MLVIYIIRSSIFDVYKISYIVVVDDVIYGNSDMNNLWICVFYMSRIGIVLF